MNVSEYIIRYLREYGVNDYFGYQGTMIAYFVDSLYAVEGVKNHVCYNEQGAALAACGYAKATGGLAVAYATSGPGAINLLQGIADAYYDSTPVLFITGQLNISEYTSNKDIRQQGFQETDIVSISKPITKMSIQIQEPKEVFDILPLAVHTALEGRKGPVLIDLPMDIQKQMLDTDGIAVSSKNDTNDSKEDYCEVSASAASVIHEKLMSAKRPVFLLGNGVNASTSSRKNAYELIKRYRIPTITTMLSTDLMEYDNPYNFGFVGYAYGSRYANFILDLKTDLIISLGAKLCPRQIGLRRKEFAKNAQIIRVDLDENELKQSLHSDDINYCVDVNEVISELLSLECARDYSDWLDKCNTIKSELENVDKDKKYRIPNEVIEYFSDIIPEKSIITCDVGQHQVWVAQSFKVKKQQRVLFSGGHGAMGFALPAAIGASFVDKDYRCYCFAGDGSIQMNIQELQWIVAESIPVKIIVLNNQSLGLIRQQQDGIFAKRHYGSTSKHGFTSPAFSKVAEAYGIKSLVLDYSERLKWDKEMLSDILCDDSAWLIDIKIDNESYAYPKTTFGQSMHNQFPYADESLFNELLEL